MLFICRGFDTGLSPPNVTTLSSEILVNENLLHGGGVLPVTVGLDQYPADKHSLVAILTIHASNQYVTLLQKIVSYIYMHTYLVNISLAQKVQLCM